MESNRPSMPFGKVCRVGNFRVLKTNRTLSKKQIAELRAESGLPKDFLGKVKRDGLPYIKVSAISGVWGVEFTVPTAMFYFLDSRDYNDADDLRGLGNLFTTWLADTTLIGDLGYWKAKGQLVSDLVSRQSKESTDAEHEEALKEVMVMQDAKEKMEEATAKLKNDIDNGEH